MCNRLHSQKPRNKQVWPQQVSMLFTTAQTAFTLFFEPPHQKQELDAPQTDAAHAQAPSGRSYSAAVAQALDLLQQRRKRVQSNITLQKAKESSEQRIVLVLQQKLVSKEHQIQQLKQQLKDQKRQQQRELQEQKVLVRQQEKQLKKQQKMVYKKQIKPDVHQVRITCLQQQNSHLKDKLSVQQQQYQAQQQEIQQCLQHKMQLYAENARLKADIQALKVNNCEPDSHGMYDGIALPVWFVKGPVSAVCCDSATAALNYEDQFFEASDGSDDDDQTADCNIVVVSVAPAAASADHAAAIGSIAVKPAAETVTAAADDAVVQSDTSQCSTLQIYSAEAGNSESNSSSCVGNGSSSGSIGDKRSRFSLRWRSAAAAAATVPAIAAADSSTTTTNQSNSGRWWSKISTRRTTWSPQAFGRSYSSMDISFSRSGSRRGTPICSSQPAISTVALAVA